MSCSPATAAAASSMPLASAASSIIIAALEARIEASEAAHRAAEGTIQRLREENNKLHSTILELEQRIEHLDELPELLKTTALEFIRDN
jgi:predicted RNase H-like nuclease (RuvC/YqgF family)